MHEDLKQYLGKPKPCLICNHNKKKIWARDNIFEAVECCNCGFVWVDPFLTKEGLNQQYKNYIQHRLEEKVRMTQRDKMYEIDRELLQRFVDQGRLLDIGCSGGFFLDKLSNKFDKYGIEIDPEAVNYARQHFSFGKQVYNCQLGEDNFPKKYFDVIIMRGVIEHLPDPKSALKRVSELLKENGYFYIAATPNVDSFCAYLYRKKWRLFNPIQHIYYFSLKTLSNLASVFELQLVDKDYPYLDTPYANAKLDYAKILKDVQLINEGKREKIKDSPPFWGSIMNAIFQKRHEKEINKK